MAFGLSAKLPIHSDPDDGQIALNKTYIEVAKQNLKNLLLTIPGERLMIPDFGVGLKRYLFESNNLVLQSEISTKINQQVSRYLSYIEIMDIKFQSLNNILSIKLIYNITPLETIDEINITREDDDIVFT